MPEEPAGVVVALCRGHRCAALTRSSGDGGLADSVGRSSGGVLVSAPCMQQCAQGAVAAVALRTTDSDLTGPALWLGGVEAAGHLASLGRWIEEWTPTAETGRVLPDQLRSTVLGVGPPVRLHIDATT
ncbi:hypothetical protein [Arthrobacter pityocampae]|uniref:hypothetical protein n=1 Tax=Arthrobacter pityocampae TaxID=547334 RepID=UPI003734EEB6